MMGKTMLIRLFRRLRQDNKGVAALEFGLIAPIMAAAFILTLDVSLHVVNRMRMESAVRAGLQYLMNNGRDLAQLENIVQLSWSSKPADADISAVRYCLCSDVAHVCDTLCADNSAPESYFTVNVVGTLDGFVIDSKLEANEVVRVR
jgi:Flp pilus assembly protein TadG